MNEEAALAVIEILEAAAAAIRAVVFCPESPPAACDHPEDQRIDLSTMGHPRWQCKLCGHLEEVTTIGSFDI